MTMSCCTLNEIHVVGSNFVWINTQLTWPVLPSLVQLDYSLLHSILHHTLVKLLEPYFIDLWLGLIQISLRWWIFHHKVHIILCWATVYGGCNLCIARLVTQNLLALLHGRKRNIREVQIFLNVDTPCPFWASWNYRSTTLGLGYMFIYTGRVWPKTHACLCWDAQFSPFSEPNMSANSNIKEHRREPTNWP